MSQSYTQLSGTVAAALAQANLNFDALLTIHSGATEPSPAFAYMPWIDTAGASAVLKIRNGGNSGWITLFELIDKGSGTTPTGGGLVRASAGAFTTAAPTSAVAASTSTHLARKAEIDLRPRYAVIDLGTLSATTNRTIMAASGAITVLDVAIVSEGATTSDASNKWEFQVDNVTDTLNLRSSAKSTNGAEVTANTRYALGLDQNLSVGANDVLRLTATLTGSPGNLTDAVAILGYTVAT